MFKKILKVTLLISVAIVASTWLVYLTEKHTTVMIRQISNIDDQHLSSAFNHLHSRYCSRYCLRNLWLIRRLYIP